MPAKSVTATLITAFGGRFTDGMKVMDNPSFDSVSAPVMFVEPLDRETVPGITALLWTGCENRTITRPFSGTLVASFAGCTWATDGKGTVKTVSATALLDRAFSVTTTFPVVAPSGTETAMLVGPQAVGAPGTPLNVTVLVPCAEPKFVPVIVMDCPTVAEETDRLVILGTGSTVNGKPFELPFEVVITTFPLVAPFGTGTATFVPFQPVGVAAVPLKVTVLVPWTSPKFTP